MSDQRKTDRGYQVKKGYQPKPKPGGIAQDGYQPTKSETKTPAKPPPKKP
jgi:hypothetical protein